jgi:hypothetical protein
LKEKLKMQYKGINYDVGTRTVAGGLTREIFDVDIVTREIEIIRSELHCNAIRISGVHIERIVKAAEIALKMELTVWFSSSLQYENQEKTFRYLLLSAAAAEKLRAEFSNLIFVTGFELSLFTSGFVKGATGEERLKALFTSVSLIKNALGIKRTYNKRLNKFLS